MATQATSAPRPWLLPYREEMKSAMEPTFSRRAAAAMRRNVWLLFCCGMVFAMAVIGAITRLTESGLSMVEWKPLIGMLPPLSVEEWDRVFGLYQATPEYRYVNAGMSLDEFKHIFFWEWFHRFWGQLIGFAFLLPFLWFWATKRIPKGLMPKLVGLFVLGGLQGGIGWFMVVSGLVDRPSVLVGQLEVAADQRLAGGSDLAGRGAVPARHRHHGDNGQGGGQGDAGAREQQDGTTRHGGLSRNGLRRSIEGA